MQEKDTSKYYVIKERAIPEVLLKVVMAKRLLESGKQKSVQEATEMVGISRSSFYKYKDDIFEFHDSMKGRTITLMVILDDEPGNLSVILKAIADYHANILTIHQSIPIGGIADVSLSIEVLENSWPIDDIIDGLKQVNGVSGVRVLARE